MVSMISSSQWMDDPSIDIKIGGLGFVAYYRDSLTAIEALASIVYVSCKTLKVQ